MEIIDQFLAHPTLWLIGATLAIVFTLRRVVIFLCSLLLEWFHNKASVRSGFGTTIESLLITNTVDSQCVQTKKENNMTEIVGIKETLEVLDFILDLTGGFYKSIKNDGKFTAEDIANFLPALVSLPAAIEGFSLVLPELKDLNDAEMEQIKDKVINKLGGVIGIEEKWLVVAQESINIAVSGIKLFKAFKP